MPVLAMVLFNPSWVGETFSLLTRPLDHLPPSKTEFDVNPKGVRVVRGTPVFLLPGSPEAVTLALTRLVLPEIAHVVGELRRHGPRG